MAKRVLLLLAVPCLLGILPVVAHADASVVQDSCVAIGNNQIRLYFTVVNFSLPAAVCYLSFTPEPLPVLPECEVLDCGTPPGWSCFLNVLGGVDVFANTPMDCIQPYSAKGNFYITLDPGFCCYVVQFGDATGAVMLEQEECFTLCDKVAVKEETWGKIKDRYGDE